MTKFEILTYPFQKSFARSTARNESINASNISHASRIGDTSTCAKVTSTPHTSFMGPGGPDISAISTASDYSIILQGGFLILV